MTNTNKKGERNEREAANIIARVRGRGNVEKVNAYGNTDPFGLANIIAVGSDRKVLLAQVKTNSFTKSERSQYARDMRRPNFDHTIFEVWVRIDRTGWVMHRYNDEIEAFHKYLETNTCNMEKSFNSIEKPKASFKCKHQLNESKRLQYCPVHYWYGKTRKCSK